MAVRVHRRRPQDTLIQLLLDQIELVRTIEAIDFTVEQPQWRLDPSRVDVRVFICVGATPGYLYPLLKRQLDDPVVEVPISSLSCVEENYDRISPDHLQTVLDYIGLHLAPYRKKSCRWVLIDHSHSGKSIDCFIWLMRQAGFRGDVDFLNLVDTVTGDGWLNRPRRVARYAILRTPTLNGIAGHLFPRCVPEVLFWHHFTDLHQTLVQRSDLAPIRAGLDLRQMIIRIFDKFKSRRTVELRPKFRPWVTPWSRSFLKT